MYEADRRKAEDMGKRKLVVVACATVVCVAGIGYAIYTGTANKSNALYVEGVQAMEAGDYETARAAFEQIQNYEDADEILREIDYRIAIEQIENGNDADAEKILLAMEDYKDAKTYLYQITYHKVKACMEAGEYEKAEEYANQISGFQDIAQVKEQITYLKAFRLIDQNLFDQAKELLAQVSDAALVEHAVAVMNYTQYSAPCLVDLAGRYTDGTHIDEVLEARFCKVKYQSGLEAPLIMIHYTIVNPAGETDEVYSAYTDYTYFGTCHTVDKSVVDMSNQAEMTAFLKIEPNWHREDAVPLSAPALRLIAGI